MPTQKNKMEVQICFVVDGLPRLSNLSLPMNSKLSEATQRWCELSGESWESLVARGYNCSVFGKKKSSDYILQVGDRIEICGSLIATPMDARRRRAKREHKGGKM